LIKTRIDLVSLSFSNEIYQKNHVHLNVIKQLQSFVSVNTSFYGPFPLTRDLIWYIEINISAIVHAKGITRIQFKTLVKTVNNIQL
jgi:hypothetical protein